MKRFVWCSVISLLCFGSSAEISNLVTIDADTDLSRSEENQIETDNRFDKVARKISGIYSEKEKSRAKAREKFTC